jgi:hypothetical protein
MALSFSDCSFDDNMVGYAAILSIGGRISITSGLFRGNRAVEGAISVHQNGTLSTSGSCFIGNTATESKGVILVDATSTLLEFEDNFGLENTVVNAACQGVLVKGATESEDVCVVFDSDSCGILDLSPPPTSSPSIMPSASQKPSDFVECISEWDVLSSAIRTAANDNTGGRFVICSNTTFQLQDYPDPQITPLQVFGSNITVQCGYTGSREENCTVDGGALQIKIRNTVRDIRFVGLTFTGSTMLSIQAEATPDSLAHFVDCAWMVSRLRLV